MNPQKLEARIFDWFEHRYPDAGSWTTSDFHCYQDAPLELRAVVMTVRVEADIANGGLPQLLWNCFYHWRVVLRDAEAGYRLFGAPEEASAVEQFGRLFERFEPTCREKVEACVRSQDFSLFGEWCASAGDALDSPLESLFYGSADAKRQAWLRKSEARLRRLMQESE